MAGIGFLTEEQVFARLGLGTAAESDSGDFAPADATLTDLADRNIGAAAATDILDRAAGDGRYSLVGDIQPLSTGGTGANLSDPNADRLMFWDDSAGAVTWLEPGGSVDLDGTTLNVAQGGALHLAISGNFFNAGTNATGITTAAPGTDIFQLVPFIPTHDVTIDQFGINVTTAVAGSNAKLGIYTPSSDGWPDALVVESANLDCAATGFKSEAYSYTFKLGVLYWLFVRTSSTQSLNALQVNSVRGLPRNSSTIAMGSCIRRTLAFASAAPDPFGAVVAADINSGTVTPAAWTGRFA